MKRKSTNDDALMAIEDASTDTFTILMELCSTLASPQARTKPGPLHSSVPAIVAVVAGKEDVCVAGSWAIVADDWCNRACDRIFKEHSAAVHDMLETVRDRGVKHVSQVQDCIRHVFHQLVFTTMSVWDTLSPLIPKLVAMAHAVVCDQMSESKLRFFATHACLGSHKFICEHHRGHFNFGATDSAVAAYVCLTEEQHAAVEAVATQAEGALAAGGAVDAAQLTAAMGTEEMQAAFNAAVASAKEFLPTIPSTTRITNVFQAPNTFAPQSPPKKIRYFKLHTAGSTQLSKKADDSELPFTLSDLASAIEEYHLGGMHTIDVRGRTGALSARYMTRLATMAAEYKTNYTNGMAAHKIRRVVADTCNAPRNDALFRFVVPHMAIHRVAHATDGEAMFEKFDVKKRLEDVRAHFDAIMEQQGDDAMSRDAQAHFIPKIAPRSVFVNTIDSVLICVGVEDSGLALDAVFVVVDLVRATYKQRSRVMHPGFGITAVRDSKVYVVTCGNNMHTTLQGIMNTISEENHALESPEALLDHALLTSTQLVSAGRPCGLTSFNAGLRTAACSIIENMNSHTVQDLRSPQESLFSTGADRVAASALMAFVSTHGNPDTLHGTHTALKAYMQQNMQADDKAMRPGNIASLHANLEMFSCGSVYAGDAVFKRLTACTLAQLCTSDLLTARGDEH